MKKTIHFIAICMSFTTLLSLGNRNENQLVATYGVSKSDPSQIELTLNVDHTFYFQDFTLTDKKIKTHGNWELQGKKVVL